MLVPFLQAITQLQDYINTLAKIMDEAEQLEAQKLAVLGFDQENVLEDAITFRFQEQLQLIKELYQIILDSYPQELQEFRPENAHAPSHALEAFRNGQAETAHFWDLFGE